MNQYDRMLYDDCPFIRRWMEQANYQVPLKIAASVPLLITSDDQQKYLLSEDWDTSRLIDRKLARN